MKKFSVFSKLSDNAKLTIKYASQISSQMGASEVGALQLFLAIVFTKQSLASRTLNTMGIDIENITKTIVFDREFTFSVDAKDVDLPFSKSLREILWKSYYLANKLSHVYVGTEHLMLNILQSSEEFIGELKKLGLNAKAYEEALFSYATYPVGILSRPQNGLDMNPNQQSALSAFGRDLVEDARKGKIDPVIGRDLEIEKIINILSRRKKNNPIIIGESGVGKTALIEALAQRIADGNVVQSLKNCKIISLDITSVMAGSKMRGDVEEKMLEIVKEVSASPDIILFIDEIHNILSGALPGMPSDIVTVLKPALTRNEFRCIGATTSAEYRQYFEEDNALVRRFQPVMIEEMSVLDTVQILKRIKPILETHHGVRISKEAIEGAVKLSDRYVTERFLPDKAIDLLDESAATRKIEAENEFAGLSDLLSEMHTISIEKESLIKDEKMEEAENLKKKEDRIKKQIKVLEKKKIAIAKSKEYEVGIDSVRTVISKWTGIPISTLDSSEKNSLINLSKSLSNRVVGQNEAVESVSNAIKRARTGISNIDRPWASFLFLGPTGVGKTELAKALTKELFGDEDRLIQIDMSELMEMHSVSKLIGSPPGYVGYKEGGQLTERIRQNPHSVVLFDEIEKAHNDVLNILLQILEYGHLTDGKGRKVDFKNTVIILTSNIGAEEIRKDRVLGFVSDKKAKDKTDSDIESAYNEMKENLTKILKDTLRPELLNRLDDKVIFRSLNYDNASKIVDNLIAQLNLRLKELKIKVNVKDSVKEYIVKEGFSDEYGARPLRRMLQDKVENILANYILENNGNEKIVELTLDIKDNQIFITK